MTDLGTLAATIGVEALDVSDPADAVQRALNDLVVHKASGPDAPHFSGLSIYFPPSLDYLDASYQDIPDNASGWLEFLDAYFVTGEAIPPTELPAFTTDEGDITINDDGLDMTGTVEPASVDNLSGATIRYGVENEDGSTTFFGDETAHIADDGSGLVTGFYDLTVLHITDGEDTATAYISLSNDDESGGFSLEVPMAYFSPDDVSGETLQDVLLSIVVDSDYNVTDETYFAIEPDSGTYGEMTADPAGLIVPRVLTIDTEGNETWTPTTDVGLFADLSNLQYNFERLDPGTPLLVELSVTDYGGNTDAVSTVVEVP